MDIQKDKWFAVKLIYVNEVSGNPEPKWIDENYKENYVAYEESIILVKANSFSDAYEKSEKIGKENEDDYMNIYGQTVSYRLVDAVNCYEPFDNPLESGSEIYSNTIETSNQKSHEDFISNTYQFARGKKHMIMNAEFNGCKK